MDVKNTAGMAKALSKMKDGDYLLHAPGRSRLRSTINREIVPKMKIEARQKQLDWLHIHMVTHLLSSTLVRANQTTPAM
jgi:hypothetical protein